MTNDYKISISPDGGTLLISIPIERACEMVKSHIWTVKALAKDSGTYLGT
jgi:hypothetical protein